MCHSCRREKHCISRTDSDVGMVDQNAGTRLNHWGRQIVDVSGEGKKGLDDRRCRITQLSDGVMKHFRLYQGREEHNLIS